MLRFVHLTFSSQSRISIITFCREEKKNCILVSLSLFFLFSHSRVESQVSPFRVDLRHCSSPLSPFLCPTQDTHGIYTRYRLLERAVNFLWGYYAAHTSRDSYRRRTSSVLAGSRTGSVHLYLYLGLWGHPRASSLLLFLEAGFRGRPDGRDIRVDFQACFTYLPAILIPLRSFPGLPSIF